MKTKSNGYKFLIINSNPFPLVFDFSATFLRSFKLISFLIFFDSKNDNMMKLDLSCTCKAKSLFKIFAIFEQNLYSEPLIEASKFTNALISLCVFGWQMKGIFVSPT